MGVSGCGKSTVATALAERVGARMIEGDDYHPAQNVQKMHAGIPLTDTDRQGWLEQLADELRQTLAAQRSAVLACSALKRRYRDLLRAAVPELGVLFLDISPSDASARVQRRTDHFMPATLIDSQFRDLEPPLAEANVLTLDATAPLQANVAKAESWWSKQNKSPL